MTNTIHRRSVLISGAILIISGCLGNNEVQNSDDADNNQIGTLEVDGFILNEEPEQAEIVHYTDERLSNVRLFQDLLNKLDDDDERGTIITQEGEFEAVTVFASTDSPEAEEIRDAFDELPRSSPPNKPFGVYVEYGDEIIAIQLATLHEEDE